MAAKKNRPLSLTILSILVFVTGIGLLVRGVIDLATGGKGEAGVLVSVILLAAGLVYCLVARGIWNGSKVAAIVVAIVTLFALIGSVVALFEPGELLASVVQIGIAIVVLILLFQPGSRAYFGQKAAPAKS